MKHLLSKGRYSYKINTLPTKSSAYPPFYRYSYMDYRQFLQENLETPLLWFSKISTLPIKKENLQYVDMFSKLS